MGVRLVDSGWSKILTDAIARNRDSVRLVSPFIKTAAVKRLLGRSRPGSLQVLTRFNLNDFAKGVSDLGALRLLLDRGAVIRGVINLHAKLYLFGDSQAVVTSANLTLAALSRNHELGFVADDTSNVGTCQRYFEQLWERAGPNLTRLQLDPWETTIVAHLASGARPTDTAGLPDMGTDIGLPPRDSESEYSDDDPPQAFVKFSGTSKRRAHRSMSVLKQLSQSANHRICTYPNAKRPTGVKDGAAMFVGRLVKEPNDILIYGRAIGMQYVSGRDDASPEDIKQRFWKVDYPHYIRVHHGEFVAGTLENGVSLNEMMDALGEDAFARTQRNAAKGEGNTNPRRAYLRQPAVELSPQGFAWLSGKLKAAFRKYGTIPPSDMASLD
jgi:hypothetical protein